MKVYLIHNASTGLYKLSSCPPGTNAPKITVKASMEAPEPLVLLSVLYLALEHLWAGEGWLRLGPHLVSYLSDEVFVSPENR